MKAQLVIDLRLFAPAILEEVMPQVLSMEQIEEVAAGFKEDLQREANRAIRRKEPDQALAALEAIEYVDKFVNTLRLRAGSRIGIPSRAKPIRIFRGNK